MCCWKARISRVAQRRPSRAVRHVGSDAPAQERADGRCCGRVPPATLPCPGVALTYRRKVDDVGAGAARFAEWIQEQVELWRSLEGAVIYRWSGEEMALWESGPEGSPVFERGDFPFLQSGPLQIDCADRPALRVINVQNDDHFGLWLRDDMGPLDPDGHWGIFRYRADFGLATGTVQAVDVFVSPEGDVAEVRIVIDGAAVLLVAGEVSETSPVTAQVIWLDESVLVFSQPDAADTVEWFPERTPIALGDGNDGGRQIHEPV